MIFSAAIAVAVFTGWMLLVQGGALVATLKEYFPNRFEALGSPSGNPRYWHPSFCIYIILGRYRGSEEHKVLGDLYMFVRILLVLFYGGLLTGLVTAMLEVH